MRLLRSGVIQLDEAATASQLDGQPEVHQYDQESPQLGHQHCADEPNNDDDDQRQDQEMNSSSIKRSSASGLRSSSSSPSARFMLRNFINLLLVSVALLELCQPNGFNQLVQAGSKKSKKYVVVKEMGTTYKKVPIYKKVPVKVLKVVIKKKKPEKPWKKWFKKSMIVKIPQHHKHHGHHHAASEGHQTWALPAFIATPSSMSDILEAWPTTATNEYGATTGSGDYNSQSGASTGAGLVGATTHGGHQMGSLSMGSVGGSQQTGSGRNGAYNQPSGSSMQSDTATGVTAPSVMAVHTTSSGVSGHQQIPLPTSVADLKSVGSEEYPSFLSALHNHLMMTQQAVDAAAHQQQHQQQQHPFQFAGTLTSLPVVGPATLALTPIAARSDQQSASAANN